MSKNLMRNIVYLTNAEYDTLITTGTITLGSGEVVTYSENDTYITPEENATTTNAGLMSAEDKRKLDGITSSYWTLLWTNASPSSSFVEQTLSIDISNYSQLAISFYGSETKLITKDSLYNLGKQARLCNSLNDDNDEIDIRVRKVSMGTSGVYIGKCDTTFIETIDGAVGVRKVTQNNAFIPYRIYGFN